VVSLGTFTATPAIRAAVNGVLDSGRLSYGPVTQEYEKQFARLHGCKYGVASNSGTSSLVVALKALKEFNEWEPGAEVIVPALTFVATVNAVLQAGLKPVLADVSPFTFNINPAEVERKISRRTRCIIPVHLFGLPADMVAIYEIAKAHGLGIVEDSCETVLATVDNTPVGSWGDVGCFSTYTAHHLVTGVGGMATTNLPDVAKLMRSYVNHGLDLSELPTGEPYDPSFLARKFRFNRVGYSYRITELEAAIGLAQLPDLAEQVQQRQANAEYMLTRIRRELPQVFTQVIPSGTTHSWMVFPILLQEGCDKWPAMQYLQKHGIETREMVPLTNQPCYDYYTDKQYRNAEWINQSGFYVGCHHGLELAQLDWVVDTLGEYLATL
jgi:perosamine synthetase